MSETSEEIRATVLERFTRTAVAPDQEETFPVGPDSAKALGYNAQEIDNDARPSHSCNWYAPR